MALEEKGNLLHIKEPSKGEKNKGKKLRELVPCHTKFLKDGFHGDGVKGICDIHL
jgi:hypothetical protein